MHKCGIKSRDIAAVEIIHVWDLVSNNDIYHTLEILLM